MAKEPVKMTLAALNALPFDEAMSAFGLCCSATRWMERMARGRPYADRAACHAAATQHWASLAESDYLEAFAGHPKIGDLESLRDKYSDTRALAAGEQESVTRADEAVLQRLAAANARYLAQNGFIFIVCASGKSAVEMLKILEERLMHARDEELKIAAAEQAKITAIRLDKLIDSYNR